MYNKYKCKYWMSVYMDSLKVETSKQHTRDLSLNFL